MFVIVDVSRPTSKTAFLSHFPLHLEQTTEEFRKPGTWTKFQGGSLFVMSEIS